MDRYRQARENHRHKPHPTSLVARCWQSVVGVLFYCIWNKNAVDDQVGYSVNDAQQRQDSTDIINLPNHDLNSTTNQIHELREQDKTIKKSREKNVERIKLEEQVDKIVVKKSREQEMKAVKKSCEYEHKAKAAPTPRDLYKKTQSSNSRAKVSVCKSTAAGASRVDDGENESSKEQTLPIVEKQKTRQKKNKSSKKRTAKVAPSSQSSSLEAEASSCSSVIKQAEKPVSSSQSLKKNNSDFDEHRAMFYEPDGRRKRGEVIPDYYEFLIRLLHTGTKAASQAGIAGSQDRNQVTQESTRMTQQGKKDGRSYSGVMSTSLADVNNCQSPLPDVEVEQSGKLPDEEVEQPNNWPSYYPKYRKIVPIEVELGLRPPRE